MSRVIWYGDRVSRKISRIVPDIMQSIRENIAEKARQIVPVVSGKLKASIKATNKGVVVEEPYALAVEIGTSTRAAKPFVRPAIERFNKQDLKQSIK